MNSLQYVLVLLLGIFLASIAQAMLKYSAMQHHSSFLQMYLNKWVIGAYFIFLATTFMGIYAYRGIPLSLGVVLESTSYIYVTCWGVKFFSEKVSQQKILALTLIISGVMIFSLS